MLVYFEKIIKHLEQATKNTQQIMLQQLIQQRPSAVAVVILISGRNAAGSEKQP